MSSLPRFSITSGNEHSYNHSLLVLKITQLLVDDSQDATTNLKILKGRRAYHFSLSVGGEA